MAVLAVTASSVLLSLYLFEILQFLIFLLRLLFFPVKNSIIIDT